MFSQLSGSYFLPGVTDFLLLYIGARPQSDWNKDVWLKQNTVMGFSCQTSMCSVPAIKHLLRRHFPEIAWVSVPCLVGDSSIPLLFCVQCSYVLDLTDVIFLNSLCWTWWLLVNKCNNVTTSRMPTPPLSHVCLHDLSDTCRPFGINKISSKFWQHSNLQ